MAILEHYHNIKKRITKIPFLNYLEIFFWAIVLGYTLILHYHLILMDTPGELREGTPVSITRLLLEGKNPYNLENLPAFTYVYGIVYNLCIVPVGLFIDPSLIVHRWATAVFLGLAIWTLYLILLKIGVNKKNSLRGAGIFYLLNCTTYSILARPDTLGILLMLLTIYLAMLNKKVLSIIIALLAFYTKPYFLFGLGVSALYIFFKSNFKSSFLYFSLGMIIIALSAYAVNTLYPYYFVVTLGSHHADQVWNLTAFQSQLKYWAMSTGFVLAGVLLSIKNINKLSACWYLSLLAALTILFSGMGWHRGAFLIYYVHLATPFAIVAFLSSCIPEVQKQLLVIGQLAILLYFSYPMPKENGNFQEICRKAAQENILPSSIMVSEIKDLSKITNNGQTEYVVRYNEKANTNLGKRVREYKKELNSKKFEFVWINCQDHPNPRTISLEGVDKDNIATDYKYKAAYNLNIYFGAFHDPKNYGKGNSCLLELERIKK